ncbi:flagellar hook-basal body complex protein FliE [Algicola sagamiensis]|uniref:flagellar hook-basal body complex protein FliE n=1 Tax=Algicola sagamiensis TaxID=163869 RepID=UPI00036AEB57|nr:flagellar hook-basal body complex protein FliE [Algicola sagamiensis]
MEIKASDLYSQMQSMATQATGLPQDRPAQPPTEINPSKADFGDMLKNAIDKVNDTQQYAKSMVTAVEMGDRSVSLAEAMIAKEKSSIAFEATVQVRNKLVEAYKEIMSMPV